MASESKTVAEIAGEIRTIPWKVYNQEIEVDDGCGISQSYCNTLADSVEAAHRREVDAILKDRDEMYKSEQETIAKTKAWFEEYQTLKHEVAELRECLKEAIKEYCYDCIGKDLDSDACKDESKSEDCFVKRWRKALEGAEDETK